MFEWIGLADPLRFGILAVALVWLVFVASWWRRTADFIKVIKVTKAIRGGDNHAYHHHD